MCGLGARAFQMAWAVGEAMPPAEVMVYAIAEPGF